MCSCQGWAREGDRTQGTYCLIVTNIISLHIRCSPESLICRNYMCERIPGKQPKVCWENDQMEASITWNSQGVFALGHIVASEPLVSQQQHLQGKVLEPFRARWIAVFLDSWRELTCIRIYCWDSILHEYFHISTLCGLSEQRAPPNFVKGWFNGNIPRELESIALERSRDLFSLEPFAPPSWKHLLTFQSKDMVIYLFISW